MNKNVVSMRTGRMSQYICSAETRADVLKDVFPTISKSNNDGTKGVQSGIINKKSKFTTVRTIRGSDLLRKFRLNT